MNLNVKDIPDALFHDVLFVREICMAVMLDKQTRDKLGLPNGSPDVMVKSLSGRKVLVSRLDLVDRYSNTDGSKIKISSWHYGEKHMIVRDINKAMKMFSVPKNSKVVVNINGKDIPKERCIIYNTNAGKIIKEKPMIISTDAFIKQFKVTKKASKQDMKNLAINMRATKKIQKQQEENKKANRAEDRKPINSGAIGLIVAIVVNADNKVIGYRIRNLKTNKETDFATSKVKELCRNQKIKNMTIVAKDGKEFLRGVGMRKENLPRVRYNARSNQQN